MQITSLLTMDVALVRTTAVERDAIGGETDPTETRVSVKGYVEPSLGDQREDPFNRDTQIGDWQAFFPAGTDVDGWDRIEAQGRVFEIIGPPAPYVDPLGLGMDHVHVLLREFR